MNSPMAGDDGGGNHQHPVEPVATERELELLVLESQNRAAVLKQLQQHLDYGKGIPIYLR